jgi:3-oxoacyl-[acyl-carrier-protein] synthase-1
MNTPSGITPLGITAYTATSALGHGLAAHRQALLEGRSGLHDRGFLDCTLQTWIGEVAGLETALPPDFADWDCRNNRLAELGLQQDGFVEAVADARARYGADRVGVFVGTSTSGVLTTEQAYRERSRDPEHLPDWFQHRTTQNCFAVADYVRERLQLAGIASAISTACSSSAKVFAAARRAISSGYCDAAVVGGVDSLCLTTLYGFNALQLVSPAPCRPADRERRGLSIGEAAGFALVEPFAGHRLRLDGYGESSDAHHMSTPHPEGLGALAAMRDALVRGGVQAADVDYINLHGTGTPANDLAEDRAVMALFGAGTPCSSTKGYTGHTLGAAGIIEAAFALLCLELGLLPQSLNTRSKDPQIGADVLMQTRRAPLRRVLSNSFGFGGSNCSLLFGIA